MMKRSSALDRAGHARSSATFSCFRRLTLFEGVSDDGIEVIAAAARVVATERAQRVVSRGERAQCLYVIHRGRYKVAATDARGRQITLNVLGPQELIGEVALIDGLTRSADVVSLSTGHLFAIERSTFKALAHDHPSIGWTLASIVARRLRRLTERLEDRAFLDMEQRLAKRLVEAAEDLAGGVEGRVMPGTCVTLTQRDLGEIADASRERVNKQLTAWARDGVLELDRRSIRILAPDALRRVYSAAPS